MMYNAEISNMVNSHKDFNNKYHYQYSDVITITSQLVSDVLVLVLQWRHSNNFKQWIIFYYLCDVFHKIGLHISEMQAEFTFIL